MKKGKLFEILTTQLKKVIHEKNNFKVEHDVKVEDVDGITRQIDILLTINLGETIGEKYVIVECKDHNRKIDIAQIGHFADLLNSINDCILGIFVSSEGFTKSATTKAIGNGKIHLYHLGDDLNFNLENLFINNPTTVQYDFKYNGYHLNLEIKSPTKVPPINVNNVEDCIIYDDNWNLVGSSIESFVLSDLQKDIVNVRKVLSEKSFSMLQSDSSYLEETLNFKFNFDQDHRLSLKGFVWVLVSSIQYGLDVFFKKLEPVKTEVFNLIDVLKQKVSDERVELFEFENHYLQVVVNDSSKDFPRFFAISKENPTEVMELVDLTDRIKSIETKR